MPEIISKEIARRLVLGRQGLWPGRRWQGRDGVEQALRASQLIQVDTISVVARNHDLALWSRVVDYREEWLNYWLYQERRFLSTGGSFLSTRSMSGPTGEPSCSATPAGAV